MNDPVTAADAASHEPPAFALRFRDDVLWWNRANAAIYGYDVHELVGDLALLTAHKHAGDRARFRRLMGRVQQHRGGYVFEHRILTASGDTRTVIAAFEVVDDAGGGALAVGTTVDLTDREWVRADSEQVSVESLLEQVRHLERGLASRDLIGQAKGLLMARYGIGSHEAFRMLSKLSQDSNTKLVDLATRVVEGTL